MAATVKNISIQVSDSIGKISGLLETSAAPKAVLTLAHGAGAGMTHRFMEMLSNQLAEKSIAVLRFNFPYMENKKGRPDPAPIAEKTVQMALEEAHKLYPKLPVYASGKSFGGRMSSQKISKECPDYVKGIIFYGFPLHPAGKPSIDRAAHLKEISIPMLFLSGTKDTLAELPLLEKVCGELSTATLIKFEGADHSFKAGKKELIPELVEKTIDWMHL